MVAANEINVTGQENGVIEREDKRMEGKKRQIKLKFYFTINLAWLILNEPKKYILEGDFNYLVCISWCIGMGGGRGGGREMRIGLVCER